MSYRAQTFEAALKDIGILAATGPDIVRASKSAPEAVQKLGELLEQIKQHAEKATDRSQ